VLYLGPVEVSDVRTQIREDRTRWRQLFVVMLAVTLIIAVIANRTAPDAFSLAFLGLVLSSIAAFLRPAIGVHLIIFFSLVGDASTTPWWPFTKNFSSHESLLFISDGISITPLEVLLFVTYAAFILRAIADTEWRFHRGRLLAPLMIFSATLLFGFGKGVLTGHDRTVALFEIRPLLYIPLLYVLITNLFKSQRQYRIAFTLAMVAVAIQSVFALTYWRSLPAVERELLESLSEHTASVTMNLLFVFLLGLAAFKGTRWKRWAMLGLAVPVVWAYTLSQRRAGMVALFVGLVVLFAVLFVRDRRLFWRIAPPTLVIGLLVILATWNANGALGLPATAVKTVLFPGQLDDADRRSDIYRQLEAYNLWFTIRQSPFTGFGFGHPFLVVRPMPDIGFFQYWQFLPHNSVLWVWIKTGFVGFVTMLFLFARTIQRGARTAMRTVSRDDTAMVVGALAFAFMFLVFAYVDIAWDIRPAVVLALCMALCCDFGDLAPPAEEVDAPRREPELSNATLLRHAS